MSEIRTTNVNGNLHFSLPKEKILFVYPIVATEQLFIVSPTLLVNSFSGFTGASYSFSNGAVRIKGVLNPYANKIKAVVSNEKYVETPKGGEEYSFTAESFRKDGFIEIKLKPNNVYYITLFPGFSRNGVESFSPPVRIDPPIDYRETVTVLYAIEYTVSKQKPFKVTISFEADSSIRLPKLLLMQGAPKPIDKNMGQLCDRIEGLELRKGLFSRKYTAKAVITSDPVATNTKFALFTGDDSNRIRLKEVRNL